MSERLKAVQLPGMAAVRGQQQQPIASIDQMLHELEGLGFNLDEEPAASLRRSSFEGNADAAASENTTTCRRSSEGSADAAASEDTTTCRRSSFERSADAAASENATTCRRSSEGRTDAAASENATTDATASERATSGGGDFDRTARLVCS